MTLAISCQKATTMMEDKKTSHELESYHSVDKMTRFRVILVDAQNFQNSR